MIGKDVKLDEHELNTLETSPEFEFLRSAIRHKVDHSNAYDTLFSYIRDNLESNADDIIACEISDIAIRPQGIPDEIGLALDFTVYDKKWYLNLDLNEKKRNALPEEYMIMNRSFDLFQRLEVFLIMLGIDEINDVQLQSIAITNQEDYSLFFEVSVNLSYTTKEVSRT